MIPAENHNPETHLSQFGLTAFRPGQREVISTVLSGRDCLCVMPTGGGKSLCYQLPAVMFDGLTLVVSPLIALMKDQVDSLLALGLPVTFINSSLSPNEQYDRLDRMAAGEFRLVYVVPERFRSQRFLDAVRAANVKLLAVDEAHCISEWGHDFRPDYARLGYFRRMIGNPATIALTATATDQVRRDIVEQLDLSDPQTYITGFARPNLFYEVASPASERNKEELLLRFLRETPGSGIIYATTRKKTEEVAEMIGRHAGRRTVVYHAGMLPEERRAAQDAFMAARDQIVVATNAFGMGIDKADVRFVVHYNLPGSLEAYYQEAGRAGRDGEPSRCLMLYHPSDRFIQEYFIESAYPKREIIAQVYDLLRGTSDDPIQMTQQEIKESLKLPIGGEGVGNCEALLEGAGVLERLQASQNMAAVRIDSDLPTLVDFLPKQAKSKRRVLRAVERLLGDRRQELVYFHLRDLRFDEEMEANAITAALRELNELDSFTYVPAFRGRAIRMLRRDVPFSELAIDFQALERRKAAEYEKLERVVRFARDAACRQSHILRYFGEHDAKPCGHCDNCARRVRQGVQSPVASGEMARAEPKKAGRFVLSETFREAARMALSGVARTEARLPCGKTLIAQMLRGSGNKKVEKLGLHRLSTYGLLKDLREAEVVALLDCLIEARCLESVEEERFRPVLKMTSFGSEVMRGTAVLEGISNLPNALRDRYLVRAAAAKRPEQAVVSSVPDVQKKQVIGNVAEKADRDAVTGPTIKPAWYWTWRLKQAGFQPDECVVIRGLDRATIDMHLSQAAQEGCSRESHRDG